MPSPMFSYSNPASRGQNRTVVRNAARGLAYRFGPDEALAQFACVGLLDNTFYVSGEQQLDTLLTLAKEVTPEFLAKVIVYARNAAYMKETPALLLAVLATRDSHLFRVVAPQVLTNGRMVRNFFRVIRSGKVGRRGFAGQGILRKAISAWINDESPWGLLQASIGNDPTLRDIIRLVRPHPNTPEKSATLRYFVHGQITPETPEIIQRYERVKSLAEDGVTPDAELLRGLPLEKLTSLPLTPEVWKQLARQASWTQTRMHLNAFAEHGVYSDKELVHDLAGKLLTQQPHNLFPYQIFNTLEHLKDGVPNELRMALDALLEKASILEQFPQLYPDTLLFLDISGSMAQQVHPRSTVTFMQIAALFAAVILRNSAQSKVYGFNSRAQQLAVDKSMMISRLTRQFASLATGGTDLSKAFMLANENRDKAKLVVVLSDNQSWLDNQSGPHTATMQHWGVYKARVPEAKLALIDIAPSVTTQAQTGSDVANIAGYSDFLFQVLANFVHGDTVSWINTIKETLI